MNRYIPYISALALSIGGMNGAQAQSNVPQNESDSKRPEVIAYQNEIRSRVDKTLEPL